MMNALSFDILYFLPPQYPLTLFSSFRRILSICGLTTTSLALEARSSALAWLLLSSWATFLIDLSGMVLSSVSSWIACGSRSSSSSSSSSSGSY